MKNIKLYEEFDRLNESTTETFIFPNQPNEKIERSKEWIRNNPRLARREESENDNFKIEVFANGDKEQIAEELYTVLLDSGYLDNHPLFSIRIEPM